MHYPLFYDRICGFRSRPAWSSTYVIVQRVFCGGNCHLISVTLPYIRSTRSSYPPRRHSSFTDNCLNLPCTMRKLLLGNPSETSTSVHWRNIYSVRAIAIVRWRVHNYDISLTRRAVNIAWSMSGLHMPVFTKGKKKPSSARANYYYVARMFEYQYYLSQR